MTRIGWEHFHRVERYLGKHGHSLPIVEQAREFARRSLDVWEGLRPDSEPTTVRAVESHLAELALVKGLHPSAGI